ncbi:unnamed protein product [Blepharisma stoltei]|uniref:Arrestin-like N-terminal domain-containing protein n=1 Tax=Blepharisma stoltei TaxID=1481888 RepID=A0AAU9K3I1_9CILI|nr:unnamed protein product [Blepharisma stoltei]
MGTSSVKGGMHIQLESRCLQTGSEATGAINVMLQETLPPCTLMLQFKGVEKTHWVERYSDAPDADRSHWHLKSESAHFNGHQIIINVRYPIYHWNCNVPPGSYTFPFSLRLPHQLPGSFTFSKGSTHASIEYHFKSKFILPNRKKLKDKVEVHIYEKIEAFSTNIVLEETIPLEGCCTNKGTFYFKSKFSQDAYTPDQVASAIIEADNTYGNLKITHLACTLWRTVRLRVVTSTWFTKEKILEVRTRGVGIGEKLSESDAVFLNLDLPSVRHLIGSKFSTTGSIIECMYSLDSHAILEGCSLCGGENPSIEIPMIIYAMYAHPPRQIEIPQGWNPQVFEQVRF